MELFCDAQLLEPDLGCMLLPAVTLKGSSVHIRSFMLSFAFDKTLVVLRCGGTHMRSDFRFLLGPFGLRHRIIYLWIYFSPSFC